jgi:hypothetical protein
VVGVGVVGVVVVVVAGVVLDDAAGAVATVP